MRSDMLLHCGLDILVYAKQIRRIVLVLDLSQTRVVIAVGRLDAILPLETLGTG